jgi:ubiquitin carboxyl-terminal hydrolase 10
VSLPTEQHEAAAEQNIISAQAVAAAASSEETAAASKMSVGQKPSTGPAQEDSSAAPKEDTYVAKPAVARSSTQPVLPLVSPTQKQPVKADVPGSPAGHDGQKVAQANVAEASTVAETQEEASTPPKAAPTRWANLFAKAASAADKAAGVNGTASTVNGDDSTDVTSVSNAGLFPKSNANSIAEVIRAYKVHSADKVSLIEPRGLINTGNMCYMNSVSRPIARLIPVQADTRPGFTSFDILRPFLQLSGSS